MIKKRKKALTLIEVLVALILLAVIMGGVVNLFISGKRWILHLNYRMAGGELGRNFLDPLQTQVRQDQWGTNCLGAQNAADCTALSAGPLQDWVDPTTNILYHPDYIYGPAGATGHLRRVQVIISWQERNPN